MGGVRPYVLVIVSLLLHDNLGKVVHAAAIKNRLSWCDSSCDESWRNASRNRMNEVVAYHQKIWPDPYLDPYLGLTPISTYGLIPAFAQVALRWLPPAANTLYPDHRRAVVVSNPAQSQVPEVLAQ